MQTELDAKAKQKTELSPVILYLKAYSMRKDLIIQNMDSSGPRTRSRGG